MGVVDRPEASTLTVLGGHLLGKHAHVWTKAGNGPNQVTFLTPMRQVYSYTTYQVVPHPSHVSRGGVAGSDPDPIRDRWSAG